MLGGWTVGVRVCVLFGAGLGLFLLWILVRTWWGLELGSRRLVGSGLGS